MKLNIKLRFKLNLCKFGVHINCGLLYSPVQSLKLIHYGKLIIKFSYFEDILSFDNLDLKRYSQEFLAAKLSRLPLRLGQYLIKNRFRNIGISCNSALSCLDCKSQIQSLS